MKLLVFGRTGQVASELARHLPAGISAEFLGRGQADLTDPKSCADIVANTDWDAVINAAAWTNVDGAEGDEQTATRVNADAPGAMAHAAAARNLPFLHLSSDYVFDGRGSAARRPDDPTGPISAYGRSKLAGEDAVREARGPHLILRTSWVFSAFGANFVKTMLRLGAEREEIGVVSDQIGGPTPAAEIAKALLSAAATLRDGHMGGTHHFSGAPDVSWADFATAIMETAGLSCRVNRISTREFPTPAPRPLNSRLDCTSFGDAFGIDRPSWQDGLRNVIEQIESNT